MDDQIVAGRLHADAIHRYYYSLADKTQKRHVGLSLLLAAIALLAGVLLIVEIPTWGSAIAFFAVTLLSVAFLYRRDAEHGALASLMSIQYRHLVAEWDALRHGEPTQTQVNELRVKHDTIGNAADLPNDDGLLKKAYREARSDAKRPAEPSTASGRPLPPAGAPTP